MSKNNKSIQDKINQLSELVAWFDGDEFELEEALTKFEEAKKLADDIEDSLVKLENEITIVKKDFDAKA